MNKDNIRWKLRFINFVKALLLLEEAVTKYREIGLSKLEEQGLIQRFEFTHELAWNVLKDFFVYQGNTGITGSRDATREAFRHGLIEDGQGWMEMLQSRNLSTHTYDEQLADNLAKKIATSYIRLFTDFRKKMESRYHD